MNLPVGVEVADAIGRSLCALLPAEVRSGVLAIDPRHVDDLRPSELAAVAAAVPSRRAEFATGRALLRELTGAVSAIDVGPDRAPLLPDGWIGSLSHTATLAVAAVAHPTTFAAVGVDLEAVGPMSAEERAIVLREDDPPLDGRAAMVLKEAAYKAWSALGGPLIDFRDLRLDVVGDVFTAVAPSNGALLEGNSPVLEGRWTGVAGHWLAAVVVPS